MSFILTIVNGQVQTQQSGTELQLRDHLDVDAYKIYSTSGDLVLEPEAASALVASSTGNARGDGAVDLQQSRAAVTQVAAGADSTIGGGTRNTAGTQRATVGGGYLNTITDSSQSSTIAGGFTNSILSTTSLSTAGFIGGGANNEIDNSIYAAIGGGNGNNIDLSRYSYIGGGFGNSITTSSSEFSVICGGQSNTIDDSSKNVIVGGELNEITVTSDFCTIASGLRNEVTTSDYCLILGGRDNTINGGSNMCVINIGDDNLIRNCDTSAITGGTTNTVDVADFSVICGGLDNTIDGDASGASNTAILGGQDNTITLSDHAAILGGRDNDVPSGSDYGVAYGYGAVAQQIGIVAHANGFFTAAGDAQEMDVILRGQSTDASGDILYIDGSTTELTIPDDTCWNIHLDTVGLRDDGTEGIAESMDFCVRKDGTSAATNVGTLPTGGTVIGRDFAGSVDAVPTLPSGGIVRITVTGEASKNINWVAHVKITQVQV